MTELFTTVGSLRVLLVKACDIFTPHFAPRQLLKLSPKKSTHYNVTNILPTNNKHTNGKSIHSSSNDLSTSVCAAFATVSVCEEAGTVLYKFNTEVQPCYDIPTDGLLDMGEEFLFDNINSSCVLSIALYSILSSSSGGSTHSTGREKENDNIHSKSLYNSKSTYNIFLSALRSTTTTNSANNIHSLVNSVHPENLVICVGKITIPVSRLEENKSVSFLNSLGVLFNH